tara:strand:+ start:4345 stop:5697 length:1353 start_codon:yes stop_codon:yes gene_type:complete
MIDNHNQNVSSIWNFKQKKSHQLPSVADVVIIGGGIIGVSTAYFLAKSGVNVCLCEKGFISGEQSGRNWGWVRVQGRDEREIPLMLRSLELWRSLSDEIQGDTGYKESGCLYSAYNHNEMDSYDSWLKLAKKYDIKTDVLNKTDLEKEAGQVAKRWIGGIITKTDGRAEPHQATISIAKAARNLGAKIFTNTAVRGIEKTAGNLSAVITEDGPIKTSTVICAAGAWSSYFCRSLGVTVPQLQVKGTVARTNPIKSPIKGNIFDKNISIRKREDGGYTVAHGAILDHSITPSTIYFGPKYIKALMREFNVLRISIGKDFFEHLLRPKSWNLDKMTIFEQIRTLDPSPNMKVLKKIKKNIGKIYPELKNAEIIESWAGMVETTPDVIPIISEIESIPGFLLATGFSGHGFGIGPAAGEAISNMVQNRSTMNMEDFKLKRFFDGSPITMDAHI